MKVLSMPGSQCPREDNPAKYIPDAGDPVEVPDTMYYRRLINDGSLILSAGASRAPKPKREVKTNE